jgi:hypothetical protein
MWWPGGDVESPYLALNQLLWRSGFRKKPLLACGFSISSLIHVNTFENENRHTFHGVTSIH